MFNSKLFYLLCCATIGIVSEGKTLPKGFPVCKRNDPNLNNCLKEATASVKPYLIEGIKELGIPSIDPLHIDKLTMHQGSQSINFTGIMRNVKIYNLKTYEFSKFEFDPNALKFHGVCTMKNLKTEADFDVTGKFLVLPLNGIGKIVVELGEMQADIREECTLKQKNGQDYILPTKIITSIKLKEPKMHVTGLFKDKAIDNNLNQLINENIDSLVRDITPFFEDFATRIMTDKLFSKIEGKVPYDNLFPIA